ncbi:MAG: alpha/beta hydrolase-fold protein [Hyphomonadaceae bacterium]
MDSAAFFSKLLAALAAIACLHAASFADPPQVVAEGDVTLPRTHQFLLRAKETGREYVVRVAEPVKASPAGQKPPVIYVLDGNWYFGLATDVARMLPVGTSTPPVYVVAIGYSDPEMDSVVAHREFDLMHGPFPGRPEAGGGGAAFQSFLVNDLRPFIEQRYGIDSERAFLAGQSLGGLFATKVMLNRPDSFAGYLIGSPSLWADDSILPAAKRFAAGGGRRVMIGVGAEKSPNMRSGAEALSTALKRPDSGLSISSRKFDNQHHMSMQGPWFAEGFRYLLDAQAR